MKKHWEVLKVILGLVGLLCLVGGTPVLLHLGYWYVVAVVWFVVLYCFLFALLHGHLPWNS